MERTINRAKCAAVMGGIVALALMLCAFAVPASAHAGSGGLIAANSAGDIATQDYSEFYKYNADRWNATYPGVFTTKVETNAAATADDAEKIGIWAIDDKNNAALATAPTTESPAIICGSAVPWYQKDGTKEEIEAAKKENARMFTKVSEDRLAPYSYFKFGVDVVKNADGTPKVVDGKTIPKLTGFDGTYVIMRIDVSNLFKREDGTQIKITDDDADQYYLHVQQAKNNALLVAIGQNGKTFSNLRSVGNSQVHYKVGSYNIKEMLDTLEGDVDKNTPYFDVVLFSTASIVSGADAQKEGALTGDVELSFYVDKQAEKPEPTEPYDPQKQFNTTEEQTAYVESYFKKYYDEETANKIGNVSRYKVMGSTFALETMVEKSGPEADPNATTFWSLRKSLQEYEDASKACYYDTHGTQGECGATVTLMSEVPIIKGLALEGSDPNTPRKRTLDVNSFDVQVANNTSAGEGDYTSGLTLKNAWLEIDDNSNTTGAELAVGNNARMTIDAGGKFVVGEKCQLEIEWDGATTQPAAEGQPAPAPDILNNGSLDLNAGGELQNKGVITIEGTEGKPYQPGAGEQTAKESAKGHGEMTICKDATFTNEGCFMPNGALYIQGTFVNKGKYDDNPIVSNDPDKGKFTYHRGIQATWKDDVTQSNVIYGGIYVGMNKNWEQVNKDAVLENDGDILLCPGELVNMATVKNNAGARILLCATDKATIPIEPDPNNPTVTTKEVTFDTPKGSVIYNWGAIENAGEIKPAHVTVETTGSLGELATDDKVDAKFKDCFALFSYDEGKVTGNGTAYKHDMSRATIELRRRATSYDSVVYNGYPWRFDVVAFLGNQVYLSPAAFSISYQDANGKSITADQVVNAGTYKFILTGNENFTGTAVKTLTVTKAANTMVLKGKTAKLKQKAIKKKAKTITCPALIGVSNAKGKVTYKLASVKKAKFKKYFKMNATTGKLKVKKGLKKGTYKLKVKVTALGDGNYTGATKTVTCKVKVA